VALLTAKRDRTKSNPPVDLFPNSAPYLSDLSIREGRQDRAEFGNAVRADRAEFGNGRAFPDSAGYLLGTNSHLACPWRSRSPAGAGSLRAWDPASRECLRTEVCPRRTRQLLGSRRRRDSIPAGEHSGRRPVWVRSESAPALEREHKGKARETTTTPVALHLRLARQPDDQPISRRHKADRQRS
jgi:hypothetical protein